MVSSEIDNKVNINNLFLCCWCFSNLCVCVDFLIMINIFVLIIKCVVVLVLLVYSIILIDVLNVFFLFKIICDMICLLEFWVWFSFIIN